jgi:hypothetical protein
VDLPEKEVDARLRSGTLGYDTSAQGQRGRRSTWSVLAFILALVALSWVGYVELMQTDLFIRFGLLDRVLWGALDPIAWLPCAVAAALSIAGLTRHRRDRSFYWVALALAGGAFLWWLFCPALWR